MAQKSAEFYDLIHSASSSRKTEQTSICRLFRKRKFLKPLLIGCTMQIVQQFTGLMFVYKFKIPYAKIASL